VAVEATARVAAAARITTAMAAVLAEFESERAGSQTGVSC
jgi:hypothetical protein